MGVGEAVVPGVVAEILHLRVLGREGCKADGPLDEGPRWAGAPSAGAVRVEASTGWRLRAWIRSTTAEWRKRRARCRGAVEGRRRTFPPSDEPHVAEMARWRRPRSTSAGILPAGPMDGLAVAVESIGITFRSGGDKSGGKPAPTRPLVKRRRGALHRAATARKRVDPGPCGSHLKYTYPRFA